MFIQQARCLVKCRQPKLWDQVIVHRNEHHRALVNQASLDMDMLPFTSNICCLQIVATRDYSICATRPFNDVLYVGATHRVIVLNSMSCSLARQSRFEILTMNERTERS